MSLYRVVMLSVQHCVGFVLTRSPVAEIRQRIVCRVAVEMSNLLIRGHGSDERTRNQDMDAYRRWHVVKVEIYPAVAIPVHSRHRECSRRSTLKALNLAKVANFIVSLVSGDSLPDLRHLSPPRLR